MIRRQPRRVTFRGMGKKKAVPHRVPQRRSHIKSIRITDEQLVKLNAICVEKGLSITAYVQEMLDRDLTNPEERAIRSIEDDMARRGVTLEMLAKNRGLKLMAED